MEAKIKKTLNRVANVFAVIIGIIVLIVAVSAISSAANGYTSFFGYTVYAVKTDSMDGGRPDSFKQGDLIIVRLLNENEKETLQPEQIITFWDFIGGKRELNTHRIKEVYTNNDTVSYATQGDNPKYGRDAAGRDPDDIVGVYSSKVPLLGSFVLFVQSPTGFLLLVVIPSVLVVIYCAYLMIRNLKDYNKEKKTQDYEKMREEVLKELQKKESEKQNPAETKKE